MSLPVSSSPEPSPVSSPRVTRATMSSRADVYRPVFALGAKDVGRDSMMLSGRLPVSSSPRESNADSWKHSQEDAKEHESIDMPAVTASASVGDMAGSQSLGAQSASGSKSISRIARRTRASFRARTSLEDTFSNQLRVLVMVQSALIACGCVVVGYVSLRNVILCDRTALIASGITDNDLLRAIPNVYWAFAIDYGLVFGFVGSQCVLTLVMCFISPAIRPTKMQYIVCSITTSIVMFCFSLVAFCIKPRLRTYARALVLTSLVIALTIIGRLNGRRYATIKPATAPRNRRLAWLVLKFGVVFFIGYYFKIEFAQTVFPSVRTAVGNRLESLAWKGFWRDLTQSLTELACVIFFFSIYFPFWSRVICYIALEISDMYNDDRSTNVEVLERIQVCMNFLIDLLRFIYGRGVLFKLSHWSLFTILVLKDNAYNLWHFAFKYLPSYVVFMLKVFYPGGGRGIQGGWRYIARIIEIFVRAMGIPKRLAVNWVDEVDYRESDPTKCTFDRLGSIIAHSEPETPVSIAIRFANVQVNINNVPVSLGKKMAGVMKEQDAGPAGTAGRIAGKLGLHSPSSSASSAPAKNYKSKVRRGSIALTGLDQNMAMPHKRTTSTNKTATISEDDVAAEGKMADTESYPSFPHLPVSVEELRILRGLCECIQFKLFQRYQTRFLTKFYTSYLFMFVPMIGGFTNAQYLPAFQTPLDGKQYFFCGMVFLTTDLLEWLFITFCVFYKSRGFHEKVDHYRILFRKNKWIPRVIVCLALLFGILWFQVVWDPWEKSYFDARYSNYDLDEIVNICKPFFKTATKSTVIPLEAQEL